MRWLSSPFNRSLAVAVVLLALVMAIGVPRTLWEFDEPLFVAAILDYEPLEHHPPPPGYPLFIGLGKLARWITGDAFRGLLALAFAGSLIGFVALAQGFRRVIGDRAGLAAALLFHLSPAMLVHATLPQSDAPGLGFFAGTLYVATRLSEPRRPALFALLASLTIGCRPQLSLAILPLLGWAVVAGRGWRDRIVILGVFTLVSLAWTAPLVAAVGGVEAWWRFETAQASYVAEHDAALSRSGATLGTIAVRFIAHPWGPKALSIPILLLAAIGMIDLLRKRERLTWPFAAACGVYLAAALAIMDPADAVRYALPSLAGVALLAAAGAAVVVRRARALDPVWLIAAYGIAAIAYVSPILRARRSSPSPPAAAANFARATLPKDAVVLYELPLFPHATLLLKPFRPSRIDDGLREHYATGTPLYFYTHGASRFRPATTFSWPESDAYGKLTRNHFRVVSLVPLPPSQRFLPLDGVYAQERAIDGLEWRWLGATAELRLPPLGASRLKVVLGLPPTAAIESNLVRILVDGAARRDLTVRRGESAEIEVAVAPEGSTVRFESRDSYIPARVPGSLNADLRRLAVKLHFLEQLASGEAPPATAEPARR